MASIIIVTKQCYLVCEGINHISINEDSQDCAKEAPPRKKKSKKLTRAQTAKKLEVAPYRIIIDFIPTQGSNPVQSSHRNSSESSSVQLTVHGRTRTLELFNDMVEQIREQLPDHVWLDKLVERLIKDHRETK